MSYYNIHTNNVKLFYAINVVLLMSYCYDQKNDKK